MQRITNFKKLKTSQPIKLFSPAPLAKGAGSSLQYDIIPSKNWINVQHINVILSLSEYWTALRQAQGDTFFPEYNIVRLYGELVVISFSTRSKNICVRLDSILLNCLLRERVCNPFLLFLSIMQFCLFAKHFETGYKPVPAEGLARVVTGLRSLSWVEPKDRASSEWQMDVMLNSFQYLLTTISSLYLIHFILFLGDL